MWRGWLRSVLARVLALLLVTTAAVGVTEALISAPAFGCSGTLATVVVAPTTASIAQGQTRQFTQTGTYLLPSCGAGKRGTHSVVATESSAANGTTNLTLMR